MADAVLYFFMLLVWSTWMWLTKSDVFKYVKSQNTTAISTHSLHQQYIAFDQ